MGDIRRRGRWPLRDIVALERGAQFNQWTTVGSTWTRRQFADHLSYVIEWNNGGSAEGTALWRFPFAKTGITGVAGTTHIVSIRVIEGNSSADIPVAPATCLHGATTPRDGYAAVACNVATVACVKLVKISGGVESQLAIIAQAVQPGDSFSLVYTWSGSAAVLYGLVNGAAVLVHTDSSSPYDFATLTAQPGIFGRATRAHSTTIGTVIPEWWVSIGASYREIPEKISERCGAVQVEIMTFQRFSDSATPTVKRLWAGDILSMEWDWRRQGGCGEATIKYRYPEDLESRETYFEDPTYSDWDSGQWHGGLVDIYVVRDPRNLADTIGAMRVYRGRIRELEFDSTTKVVTLSAMGLGVALDEIYTPEGFTWENETLKTILEQIFLWAVRSGAANLYGTYVLEPPNISTPPGLLSKKITHTVDKVPLSSVIREVLEFAPAGLAWGCGTDGRFYVLQEQGTYFVDDGSGFLPVSINVKQSGVSFKRSLSLEKLRTVAQCLGKGEAEEGRPQATAHAQRARELYGYRAVAFRESAATDAGLCGKLAQAKLRETGTLGLECTLRYSGTFGDGRSFWPLLVPQCPHVILTDKTSRTLVTGPRPLAAVGGTQETHTPYQLRRFGDVAGKAIRGVGASGSQVTGAAVVDERLGREFLLHAALKFTTAHSAPGDRHFILGRPGPTWSTGWGILTWEPSGKLYWHYYDQNLFAQGLDTGITVNAAAPADTVVNLTIFRSVSGYWYFYNGTSQTASYTVGYTSDPTISDATAWMFFSGAGAGTTGWAGDFDCFWFYDTNIGSGVGIGGASAPLLAFISRNNGKRLHRTDGCGLLLWIPGNEDDWSPWGGTANKVWAWRAQAGGWSVEEWTYTSTGVASSASAISTQPRGSMLGNEQRWGGPMVRRVERGKWRLYPGDARMDVNLELGGRETDLIHSMAEIQAEAKRQEEIIELIRGGLA